MLRSFITIQYKMLQRFTMGSFAHKDSPPEDVKSSEGAQSSIPRFEGYLSVLYLPRNCMDMTTHLFEMALGHLVNQPYSDSANYNHSPPMPSYEKLVSAADTCQGESQIQQQVNQCHCPEKSHPQRCEQPATTRKAKRKTGLRLIFMVIIAHSLKVANACTANPLLQSPKPCNALLNTEYTATVLQGTGTQTLTLNSFFANDATPTAGAGYVSKTTYSQNDKVQCNGGTTTGQAAYGCGSKNAVYTPDNNGWNCGNSVTNPSPGSSIKCACLLACSTTAVTFDRYSFGNTFTGVAIQSDTDEAAAYVTFPIDVVQTITFSVKKNFKDVVLAQHKSFSITIQAPSNTCSQDLQPLSATMTFSKQKGTGTQTLISASEFTNNQVYQTPTLSVCAISDWFISEESGTTAVTSGTIFTKMLISSKAAGVADLKVDTTVADIKDYEYRMKLWVYKGTGADKRLNSTPITISVKVGCFNQESVTAAQASGTMPAYFKQFASTTVTLLYPRTASVSTVTETVNLASLVTFSQTTANCGAKEIAMYTDTSRNNLATDSSAITFPTTNPRVMDATTYIVSQSFTFNYDSTTTATMNGYLKITGRGTPASYLNYQIDVTFCNHQPQTNANTLITFTFSTSVTTDQNQYWSSMFQSLSISETQCQGIEYYFETSPANQAAAFTQINTNYLTIKNPSAQTPGSYTLTLTMKATKSLLTASRNIQIDITSSGCASMPTASPNTISINIQKNKQVASSYVGTVKTFTEIKAMWDAAMQAASSCDIQEWIVAASTDTTGTALTAGNAIFDRLQQPTTTSDLKISTQQDYTDQVIVFKIYVKVGSTKVLNLNNPVTVTLNIKCSEETLNSYFTAKASVSTSVIYYQSSSTNAQKRLNIPKLETGTNSITIKLSDLITRQTDYAFCGPQTFTAYSDSGLTTAVAANSEVRTQTSPTNWDTSTGLIDMDILINYGSTTTLPKSIYLKPSISSSSQTNVEILVNYCTRAVSIIGVTTLTLSSSASVDLTTHFSETTATEASGCIGHEYRIDNFQVVSGATMTVSQITFTGETMNLPSNIYGQYTFDLWIVATKSLNKVKKSVTLSLSSTCASSMLLSVKTPLEFNVQKNKKENSLTQLTLVQDIKTLFATQTDATCAINGWYLSPVDQTTKYLDSDPIAIQMLQVGRTIGLDSMKIESTYSQTDLSVEFMVRIYLQSLDASTRILNTNPQIIKVNVGCYEEKLTAFWNKKTGATDPDGLVSYASLVMKFLFVVPAVAETKVVSLASFFELKPDFDQCGAKQVTSFSDEAQSTKSVAGTASGLATNPTVRSGGVTSPILNIVLGPTTPTTTMVYMVAETDSYNLKSVKSVVTVQIDVCSDEPMPISLDAVAIPEGSKDPIKLMPLFKFSPVQVLCQGYEVILSTTNQPIAATIAPFAILNGDLTISAPITSTSEFYVVMRSTKSMKFGAVKFTTKYTSPPPTFKTTLSALVPVQVTVSDKGELVEAAEFLFTSPQGVHPTGNPVKLEVVWDGTAPTFGTIIVKTDTFQVKLDRTKITKSETVKISVKLGEATADFTKVDVKTVSFNIAYKKNEPIPVAATTPEPTPTPTDVKNETASTTTSSTTATTAASTTTTTSTTATTTTSTTTTESAKADETKKDNSTNSTTSSTETKKEDPKPIKGDFVQGPSIPAWQTKSSAADVAAFWSGQKSVNKTNAKGNKEDKNAKERTFYPLKYTVDFRRNGTMFVVFNQNIVVPKFDLENKTAASNSTAKTRRQLLLMSEINVGRDLFDIEFDIFNEAGQNGNLEYFVDLVDWNEMRVQLQFNFSKPLIISQGEVLDKIYIKIKDRKWFVAKESGWPVEEIYVKKDMVALVPRQLPTSIDAEKTESTMQNSKNMMLSIMIVQIVLQLILNQSVNTIIDLLLAMQMLVYIKEFNLNIPALVEMLLDQFKSLIQFDAINPESITKTIIGDDDFTFVGYITGIKQSIVNEDQKASLVSEMMVYIIAVVILVAVLIILIVLYRICAKKYKDKIKEKLRNMKKKFMWNDSILSYRVAHFTTAIAAGDQFKLKLKESPYLEPMNLIFAIVAYSVMTVFMVFISVYLLKYYDKLPDKRDKIGMLYPNVSFKRDRLIVLRYPLFMLHRMLYVMYACVFFTHITFAVQLLIMTTLLYTMFRFAFKPSLPKTQIWLERFTDLSLHMILLQLLLFTDYVPSPEIQFIFSFLYIGTFCSLFVIYIGTIIRLSLHSFFRMRRLKKIKKMKIEMYQAQQQTLQEEEKDRFKKAVDLNKQKERQGSKSISIIDENPDEEGLSSSQSEQEAQSLEQLNLINIKAKNRNHLHGFVMNTKIEEAPEDLESDNSPINMVKQPLNMLRQNTIAVSQKVEDSRDPEALTRTPSAKIVFTAADASGDQKSKIPSVNNPRVTHSKSFVLPKDTSQITGSQKPPSILPSPAQYQIKEKVETSNQALQKLLSRKSVQHPGKHPLEDIINEKHLIPGIKEELHPGLTYRYSDIKSLTLLSLKAAEIEQTKKQLKQIIEDYRREKKKENMRGFEQQIQYNKQLIDIEFKMRTLDLICQRDILLKDFKERNTTTDMIALEEEEVVTDNVPIEKDEVKGEGKEGPSLGVEKQQKAMSIRDMLRGPKNK